MTQCEISDCKAKSLSMLHGSPPVGLPFNPCVPLSRFSRHPAYERVLRHRGGSFKSRLHRVRRRWHSCSVLVRQGAKGTALVEAFPHPAFEVVLIHDALTVQRKQVVLRCANLYQLAFVRVIAFWR